MDPSDDAHGLERGAESDPPEAEVDRSEVLELLGDDDCRAVLAAVARACEAPSVADLAASLAVPESTLYRKLDRLTETPLVDARASVSTDGHPRTRYVAGVTDLTLRFDDEASVTIETADGETVTLDTTEPRR